jgi:AbrB family looped-hinge helix DNA binding protein
MAGEVRVDDRGRVTIPKEVRERYGEQYRLVELDSGIKLVPIPDDPVAELRAAASDELRDASLEDLEAAAREGAHEGADEHVR